MRILYFAALRERARCAELSVTPPPEVADVGALVAWLRGHGQGHAAALSDLSTVRVAVNQDCVGFDHPVAADDEVAFFPPMTGGRP